MARLAIGTEYFLFGGAGAISLLAFGALILAPALASYGRSWEKATAVVLSVFVLAALILLGIASTSGPRSPTSSPGWTDPFRAGWAGRSPRAGALRPTTIPG
jgi:ABC-type transport system involved in multi-copper enzyme maturation permease subunit